MKTHAIKNFLIVEVPEDIVRPNVIRLGNFINIISEDFYSHISFENKSRVEYIIHSDSSTITEDQAAEIVEQCSYYAECWKNYNSDDSTFTTAPFDFTSSISCWTALESYQSLLSSMGVTRAVNLIKK